MNDPIKRKIIENNQAIEEARKAAVVLELPDFSVISNYLDSQIKLWREVPVDIIQSEKHLHTLQGGVQFGLEFLAQLAHWKKKAKEDIVEPPQ